MSFATNTEDNNCQYIRLVLFSAHHTMYQTLREQNPSSHSDSFSGSRNLLDCVTMVSTR